MIISLILLLVIFATTLFPTIANRSESELVKRTLESALVKKEIPDYKLIKSKDNFIISTENLDVKSIPMLPDVTYTLLSPGEIQEKANREGDFLYLRFKQVRIGWFRSSVSLDNVWVRSKDSTNTYLSGGGFTLTFYNILGKWIESPIRNRWIS